MKTYSQDFSVHIHQTSYFGEAQLWAIFQWFQEAAANHATILNAGVEHLSQQNLIWVMSRLSLDIKRLPKWREEMELTTWVPIIEGISTERHFRIVSKKTREVLINGGSLWFAINRQSKRPSRLEKVLEHAHLVRERAYEGSLDKIAIPEGLASIDTFSITARSSDIDIAGHVNNSIYVKWASDSLSLEEIKEAKIREFSINFISEAFSEDTIKISRFDENGHIWVEMQDVAGKQICRSGFLMAPG